MLRLGVLGGGGHSRANHLPALDLFRNNHPGRIELTAFCDVNPHTAVEVSAAYGFRSHYTDLARLLEHETLDGFIAVTPVNITARVASMLLPHRLPLLIEKPPGGTPAEVEEVCRLVAQYDGRVMVSMNRRFDPSLSAARAHFGDRPLQYLRASQFRDHRAEPGFMTDTAIHAMDAMRHLAGDVRDHKVRTRTVEGVRWYFIELNFISGATGCLEILPTCGCLSESYELFGPDCRVVARIAEFDNGTWTAWDSGRPPIEQNPTLGLPGFVRNGTYAETEAFIHSIEGDLTFKPTPQDVQQSVVICHAINGQLGVTGEPEYDGKFGSARSTGAGE